MDVNGVLKLEVHISDESQERIFQGAAEVLAILRPKWHKDDISFKMLTDGITNKLVRCKVKDGDDSEAILVRIYGNKTDMLIDRKAETRNIQMLNKFGLAPTLYAVFKNGLAYEYVPGCTITPKMAGDVNIYPLIARKMAKLHKVQPTSQETEPALWDTLDKFYRLVPDAFTSEHIQKKFTKLNITKSQIRKEIDVLKSHLKDVRSPVVFCHNDLLLGNVVYTKMAENNNEGKDKVTFIDFEYGNYNYQAYDIGNHFVEFAGVDTVNYDNYPSRELQYAWLEEYALEFYSQDGGDSVAKDLLDSLYVQVNKFGLMSHLVWGIWSLIQAEHSNIDFDFIEYALMRFTEYFRRKEEFLSLETTNGSC